MARIQVSKDPSGPIIVSFPGEHLPEFGLEIFSGRIRPIGHVLLELLTS